MSSSYTDRPEQEPHKPQGDAYTDRPALPRVGTEEEPPLAGLSNLGSLAQKARLKQLSVARGILLFIGILTIIANGAMMFLVPDQVRKQADKELREAGMNRAMVDPVKLKEAEDRKIAIVMLIAGVAVVLGVVFVIFGLVVKKFPVPVTISSLVLYIGSNLVFGLLAPETLLAGLVIKIVIIVFLAKAIQAALAYEKAAREEEALEPGY